MKNRRTWNAGNCCGMAARRNINDVRFVECIIDKVEQSYSVDKRRVYITGMSNGGMMAYRLATEIPQKIAAVIVISAGLAVDNFDAAKDVPVLHIHGTEDRFVPVAGGIGEKSISNVAHRSLADTVRLITRARHCTTPEVKELGNGVQVSIYHPSKGAPVEVVLIKGGGHTWPGGYGRWGPSDSGRSFSASRYAWEFAREFSLTTK
jgi:polyhydroxybutyrate depolymerase